jgi:hypothetical protein
MSKKHKYVVRLPDGNEATRVTGRTYTHAIVIKLENAGWCTRCYCGSPELARKALEKAIVDGASWGKWTGAQIAEATIAPKTGPKPPKATRPEPEPAPKHLPRKIRLTRVLEAFGVTIPGTCNVPNDLCDEIMADPAKFISTLVPVGTKGNWINPEPIMRDGKPYWIKVWAPDDDTLVDDCAVFDRDWSWFDPWYVG